MVRNLGILIQAHMGSTRLPGKILKKIQGKTVLGHILERLKNVKEADVIIVATSDLQQDDVVIDECTKYGISWYRGSDDNVLDRFYHAAKTYGLTDIARICSDNTLVDWKVINEEIICYKTGKYDIVTSGKTIPLGLGSEIFSFDKLEEAFFSATKDYQKEHVTPYIYEHSLHIYEHEIEDDYSKYRLTLDTIEDWTLINKIYDQLYNKEHDFALQEIVSIMKKHPEWYEINKNVKQKA